MGPEELESSFAGFLGLRVEADDEEDEEDEEIQLVRTRSDLSVCDWYEGRFFFTGVVVCSSLTVDGFGWEEFAQVGELEKPDPDEILLPTVGFVGLEVELTGGDAERGKEGGFG